MEDSVEDEEKKDEQVSFLFSGCIDLQGFGEQNNDIDFVYNDADEYGVEIAG